MASRILSVERNDLRFIWHLGTELFREIEDHYNRYISKHSELLTQKPVSPRVFRKLLDEHFDPVIEARTYLVQELSSLPSRLGTRLDDATAEVKRNEIKELGDAGTKAKDKYQSLLTRIMGVIISSSLHIDWTKYNNRTYRDSLADWLKRKHRHLAGIIDDHNNIMIKPELAAIKGSIARGMKAVPVSPAKAAARNRYKTSLSKVSKGNDSVPGKRPLNHDSNNNDNGDGGGNGELEPSRKKPKYRLPPGSWWGPDRSKLSCDDAFFDVIRQYKAYLANPTHPAGSGEHRAAMTGFLAQALDHTDMRSRLDDILMKSEWNFRDPDLGHVPLPTFIRPGTPEAWWRLGREGRQGTNDFKAMLGGGLSEAELSNRSGELVSALGMLALAHSSVDGKTLLYGGGPSSPQDKMGRKKRRIRVGTDLRFRDPDILWEELLDDVTYPREVFQKRIEELRPPMMDPDRVGRTLSHHQSAISKMPAADEWEKVKDETDRIVLESLAENYRKAVADARKKAHDFIYNSPKNLFPEQPKLNEEGGQDKPRRRYKGLRDRNFAKPIGHIFQARMYQLLRLVVVWRLYLLDVRPLGDLLAEERLHLEIWDEHEELYMEWENNRWFDLRSDYERAALDNRYKSRELLRKIWENERTAIDEAVARLEKDPTCYDHVPPTPTTPPMPITSPSRLEPPPAPRKGRSDIFNKNMTLEPVPYVAEGDSYQPRGDENDDNDGVDGTSSRGSIRHPDAAKDTASALELLEKTRDVYNKKLTRVIRQNGRLDADDPGNHAMMHRNNVDIMAKQQVLWSLDSEILNLRRSTDPLSPDSYGRGATHRWELAGEEAYLRHTRDIPPKKALPLGITSLGLGPMPGEHPVPGDPRVLVGAGPDFGRDPSSGDVLFGPGSVPPLEGSKTMTTTAAADGGVRGGAVARQATTGKSNVGKLGEVLREGNEARTGRKRPAGFKKQRRNSEAVEKREGAAPEERLRYADMATATEVEAPGEQTSQSQREDTADPQAHLDLARELWAQDKAELETARKRAEEAASEARTAVTAAAGDTSDRHLELVASHAREKEAEAEADYADAAARVRVSGLAVRAQQMWSSRPEETAAELRARFEALIRRVSEHEQGHEQGHEQEGGGYGYEHEDPRRAIDWWVIEATALMHEGLKALGTNAGPRYWRDMYDGFWAAPGATLARKRRLWLYSLAADLNRRVARAGRRPFFDTPPSPGAAAWADVSPSRAELIRREEEARAGARSRTKSTMGEEKEKEGKEKKKKKKKAKAAAIVVVRSETPPEMMASSVVQPGPSKPRTPSGAIVIDDDSDDEEGEEGEGEEEEEEEQKDAWPELKGLLQATWNANVAHEALRQKTGDVTDVPPGRPLWPRPVRAYDPGEGIEYHSL